MEPIFTLPYSEFTVVQELSRYLKKADGYSPYIPLSRQEKEVDFLVYNRISRKYVRFQVKASRSYSSKNDPYRYNFWFNNFKEKYSEGVCDFYCLLGLYSDYTNLKKIASKKDIWHPLILCLPDNKMGLFLQKVKTKKDPAKADRFFSIGFDQPSSIFACRGFNSPENVSEFILDSMIGQIREVFS